MRKILLIFMFFMPLLANGNELINKVKKLPVSALDRTLTNEPIEKWILENFKGASNFEWKLSSCAEQYDNPEKYPNKDYPLCIDIGYKIGSCEYYGIQLLLSKRSSVKEFTPKIWALYFEDYKGWELISTMQALVNKQGTGVCK